MPELRKDPVTNRWVIIASERAKRPSDFSIEPTVLKHGFCPFCYGNEDKTPPEIVAYADGNRKQNTPGWQVRVVPNKFPALQIEGEINKKGVGMYDMMNGIGAHEVIIETPEHDKTLPELSDIQVEKIITAYRDRGLDLKKDIRFEYILLFKNYGDAAGASLEHPHSQLIATPIVPKRVIEEIRGSHQYFEYKERCVFCDILRQELNSTERIISENSNFLSFEPFAPRFPFETWILPKKHYSDFLEIDEVMIKDLARILKDTIGRIKKALNDPPFNYIIHTTPLKKQYRDVEHWHFEIMPKLTKVAGFEWGSGFYINPTPPEEAAKYLREVEL